MSSLRERVRRQESMALMEKREKRRIKDPEDYYSSHLELPRVVAPVFSIDEIDATPNLRETQELVDYWKRIQYNRALLKVLRGEATKVDRKFIRNSINRPDREETQDSLL